MILNSLISLYGSFFSGLGTVFVFPLFCVGLVVCFFNFVKSLLRGY